MPRRTSIYDQHFRNQADLYFCTVRMCGQPLDWRWFKAQAMAESNLDPKAISSHGARGIMQLMPGTSAELAAEMSLPDDPFDPMLNIKMGIYYDLKMYRIFAAETDLERLRFMFAAYNAGAGNIIKAQKLASPTDQWWAVAKELPRITGQGNAWQTRTYVKLIEADYTKLIADCHGPLKEPL